MPPEAEISPLSQGLPYWGTAIAVLDGTRLPAWLPVALDAWYLRVLVPVTTTDSAPVRITVPVPCSAPSPNPTAAARDDGRVLSQVGVADHAVPLKAPWTGSGWREHSCGGFGEDAHTSTHAASGPLESGCACRVGSANGPSGLP
jgi:hypothetical protein